MAYKLEEKLSKVLYIDLTEQKYEITDRLDLFDKYLGGAGVAAKLLEEECPKGVDPLGPDNPIILTVGPLTTLYPCMSKTVAMFKSPLTGNLGESHTGGRSALAIRLAGYGAIVIKGAADKPIYLSIFNDKVEFKDASVLWGMRTTYSVGRVLREVEPGSGRRTIMRIGLAGERLVRFSNVAVETFRHFGRQGLGAVMGSKRLKALVIGGTGEIAIAKLRDYIKAYKELYDLVTKTPAMMKYRDYGTAVNVLALNTIGALPTRNLQATKFEYAENICGEKLAETLLSRRLACSHCPIGCIHIAEVKVKFAPFHAYETLLVPYDYEPIYAMGSMLGIGDAIGMLRLLERAEALGLDAMSAGVAMAWATEAFERGIITANETNGLTLRWGDVDTYIKFLDNLVEMVNDFYRALAMGTEHAASVYGGLDFALTFGGNEMPGYHVGPTTIVGFIVGARHSHLDNAGYSVDEKALKKPMNLEERVDRIVAEEQWRCVLSSLVACFFARGVYTPDKVVKLLEIHGYSATEDDLKKLGKEIHLMKYRFKLREGFSLERIRIPKRVFETPTPHGTLKEEDLRWMIRRFYEKAGILELATSS